LFPIPSCLKMEGGGGREEGCRTGHPGGGTFGFGKMGHRIKAWSAGRKQGEGGTGAVPGPIV